jgi:hypothetical protein
MTSTAATVTAWDGPIGHVNVNQQFGAYVLELVS